MFLVFVYVRDMEMCSEEKRKGREACAVLEPQTLSVAMFTSETVVTCTQRAASSPNGIVQLKDQKYMFLFFYPQMVSKPLQGKTGTKNMATM